MKPHIALGMLAVPLAAVAWPIFYTPSAQVQTPVAKQMPVAGSTPVLVELFTSEGCSSCPPADRVLRGLDNQQPVEGVRVVALGFHVDYWNRLGWKDPFSDKAYTRRQHDYAARFGNESVYTPQAVVDGASEMVGSEQGKLKEAIRQAAEEPHATVSLSKGEAGGEAGDTRVTVEDRAGLLQEEAAVWVAVTEPGLSTQVKRGENGGLTLEHAPVVRHIEQIGLLAAKSSGGTFTYKSDQPLAKGQRLVAFVQETASGKIRGCEEMR